MACLRLLSLVVLLLSLAVLARADGCAMGPSFLDLQETDQVAVIQLAPNTVTVDMYIAIDGIKKGEQVTYILPFWMKPDGFTMEEVEGTDYGGTSFDVNYIRPAQTRVKEESDRPGPLLTLFSGVGAGTVAFGPLMLIPMFPRDELPGPHTEAAAPTPTAMIAPYAVATTPNARAELYNLTAADLPTLVAQAGMPARYAATLQRYKTPYFSVMRLTGVKDPNDKEGGRPRGIHYHFTHAAPGADYNYVYPLGTGAAWPKPITRTEVYALCDESSEVHGVAPTLGKTIRYDESDWDNHGSLTITTTLATHPPRHPTAWHIAYLNSNPNEDISFHLQPSRRTVFDSALTIGRDRVLPVVLVLLALVGAWVIAALLVIRPVWRKARELSDQVDAGTDSPPLGSLWHYTVRAVSRTVVWALVFDYILVILILSQFTPACLFLVLAAPVFMFFLIRKNKESRKKNPLLTRLLLSYFYTVSLLCFLALWGLGALVVNVM